ncbi:MAG: hypothetical protein ACTSRD_11480, partial [Promethearchaeota archaeon]
MSTTGPSHNHYSAKGPVGVEYRTGLQLGTDVLRATLGTANTHHSIHGHTTTYAGQTDCETLTQTHLPPYQIVNFFMNTQDISALPVGVIALWDGASSSIPYGWDLCDGNGTPSLSGRFVRGYDGGTPIGTNGGSSSHAHIYNDIPRHNHFCEVGDVTHTHSMYVANGIAVGAKVLIGTKVDAYSASTTQGLSSSTFSHTHTIHSTGYTNPSTYSASNLPPYIRLSYIQCTDYDENSPVFTSTPADRFLEYGYTGESISWTAIDANPDDYTIDLFGTGMVVPPTYWGSGSPITYNIPNGFMVGTYTYEIDVYDMYGNPNSDSVTLTVQDTTNPLLAIAP